MIYTEIADINTYRLKLRKLTNGDAKEFYKFAGDERVSKYMNWIPHSSIIDSKKSIEKSIENYEKGKYYRWGISLQEDGSLIGIIQLLAFDDSRNSCSFAYMLNYDCWGRGYGSEVVAAVINFAFEKMLVRIIEADVFSENKASAAVMKKCGMIYIDTIKNKYEKDGVFYDADRYVITRNDRLCKGIK